MDSGAELFRANLALIDRVIARVCAKNRLLGPDADDFASEVRLELMADDYAVLRSWEGRSSLATFLTIVVQRLLINARVRERGRWHASHEAQRMGRAAVELERLVQRDGRSLDEAIPIVQSVEPGLTHDEVAAMAGRLPPRAPRPVAVAVDPDLLPAQESAETRAMAAETQRISARASDVVRRTLAAMPLEDRVILRLRFGRGMTVADVARMMQTEQRPLYRRIEASLRRLRTALAEAGIDGATAAELIGSPFQSLNFRLSDEENEVDRLSKGSV
ncbi:MAG TPA: sigma-70 family RNA polymerase sigma factor [Thermoanaerobaculia bacterium]|jgi:RNA polymerase sigma factor (sigma-70 family)